MPLLNSLLNDSVIEAMPLFDTTLFKVVDTIDSGMTPRY